MVGAKTQIIWGKVGALLGHEHGWGKVGAWLGQELLGQGWGKIGAWLGHGRGKEPELLGARLGQGWGMVGAWLEQKLK